MKKLIFVLFLSLIYHQVFSWGFFAHKKINYYAVFLLPPEMMVLYKPNIDFISEHSVDPDKRRYINPAEGPRHYLDIDHYGSYPFPELPRRWKEAVEKFSEDSLKQHGIVPWWVETMQQRLVQAFKEKNQSKILKISADLGHYIADAHVPLHASSNHNGQLTNQHGIHGFWESRIPELLAEKEWDFFIGKAQFIEQTNEFIWRAVLESAALADSVLFIEKKLNQNFPTDKKYAFEERNGAITKQYSSQYALAYDQKLNHMIERRMRQSIFAVASFWFTAWVNAGQPDLKYLTNKNFSKEELMEFEKLNQGWKNGAMKGRNED